MRKTEVIGGSEMAAKAIMPERKDIPGPEPMVTRVGGGGTPPPEPKPQPEKEKDGE